MRKRKSKQMILTFNSYRRSIFLKFCYFLIILSLISCSSDTKKEKQTKAPQAEIDAKTADQNNTKTILFFGDSLTAGYGLDNQNDAFPALIQARIDSLELDYKVINSGLSGETTAGGKSRVNWVLSQKVDIFVLELGANDGLRGVPLSETRGNLQAIINMVLQKSADTKIILAGMQLPPNMGFDYINEFKTIFPELAKKNNLDLIPFLLKDVGGIPELNQADGIHPTAEGQKILANNIWVVLEKVI